MVTKLKEFIKRIRACKTAADERGVIAKESASIRTRFKEEDHDNRHANVAKLLYIHMLGYPAHFGQMECVKLVASPRFADKRLGYLGIMLLLDENQETLTLVTNSLKNDMNHPNMYVVGLALCTLGNISSVEMSRDLCPEVEKLLGSSNSYIRKKAALAAVRIIRKVPDLVDNFTDRCRAMLGERNHGALITGITLIIEMCTISQTIQIEFRQTVPVLIKILKQLITTGYSPEHDVQGITDPFLQVKILNLLRLLGKSDQQASDLMNDVLAQLASNTDASKNVGNAILYETVLTILDIKADQTLRVLAISILGRFVSNKDLNIKYVALQTLIRTIQIDVQAVQRHRTTILQCLHDPDISIRKRALKLAFALVNVSNVRVMTRELLGFLEVADVEFRSPMVADLAQVADKYAPNKRWHLDTLIRVMKLGGNYVCEDLFNQFVKLVTNVLDLQPYAVHKLFHLLGNYQDQQGLVHASVWCIGEFGDALIGPAPVLEFEDEADTSVKKISTSANVTPTESSIIQLLQSVLVGPYITPLTKQFVLVALMKLSVRFTNVGSIDMIKQMLAKYSTSMNMELQQRSVEYTQMFGLDTIVRSGLWERMPVQEFKDDKYALNAAAAAAGGGLESGLTSSTKPSTQPDLGTSALLDLEGLSLDSGPSGSGYPGPTAITSPRDILADIFMTPNTSPGKIQPMNLMGGNSPISVSATPTQSVWNMEYPVYQTSQIAITCHPQQVTDPSSGQQLVQVNAVITNLGMTLGCTDLQLLVAVPKSHKVALAPISTSSLMSVSESATQAFRILNPEKKPIKLRLKLMFQITGGARVDELIQFAFPDSLL